MPSASPIRARAGAALLIAALAVTGLLAPPAADEAAAAKRRVPQGFLGTVIDGPATGEQRINGETLSMVRAGVESTRARFDWPTAQPYATWAQVPVEERAEFVDESGVPTRWASLDRLVASTARRRLTLLPVVIGTPGWAGEEGDRAPAGTENYTRFIGSLVRRYGPNGTFWRISGAPPKFAVRAWQIWNEPQYYWTPGNAGSTDFAPGYVRLLRAAAAEIRRLDRGATVVLAGLFGERRAQSLDAIYRQAGAKEAFDVVAMHPFTREPKNVIVILEGVRAVMRRHGDSRSALWLTELTWPGSKPKVERYGYEVTPSEQPTVLTEGLRRLVAARTRLRIGRVYWYTWLSRWTSRTSPFDYSGLRRVTSNGRVVNQRSLGSYRSSAVSLEGCTKRGMVATRCR